MRQAVGYIRRQISTHAPRTGSDPARWRTSCGARRFQPTLPARGATRHGDGARVPRHISTHAPRTGSDRKDSNQEGLSPDFNPRSPHGERRCFQSFSWAYQHFNPRSPHGERHDGFQRLQILLHFNPRSPHGERHSENEIIRSNGNFNPRSPHGERRPAPYDHGAGQISTHAPRTGSDAHVHDRRGHPLHFNPRSPHGERPFLFAP